eukprot:Transcript_22207.p2 GENE.Transcript_22207~~Transcript_22207.p2  ORF type:complete len:308 (+),score=141.94 Transcript_22207:330-1253(+)
MAVQVQGLRKAFSTLSDVLIEEVDVIRSEAAERQNEVQKQMAGQAKALKAVKTELALLRSEMQGGRGTMQTKAQTVQERLESMQSDLTLLAQEAAKGSSAQHLLQLEVVQLRQQLDEEERERRSAQEEAASHRAALQSLVDAAQQDTRSSLQALDADVGTLRTHAEKQLSAQAAGIEQAKARLLQCAQAIEKQWSTSKVQQQRLESLSSSSSLHNQQLQERMEALNKQQSRWRTALEDAVKTATADVQLLQAQCRALESAVVSGKADTRRMLSEQEAETQRQCDTLGRAIHSLADTLNLTSPLITSA